jgi:cytochrome c-type biogenesis protein CcmH
MGWGIMIGLVLVAIGLLWRSGGLTRSALELAAAALLIGIAGYAWQGSPDEPGTSVASREAAGMLDPATVASRKNMMGQFGNEGAWLDFADTMTRMGQTQGAVLAMRSGIRDDRNNVNLWIGLGNALVAHGGGIVSPAARFAFDHAARLSPKHPGPPFFLGVALAAQGQTDEAVRLWTELLARSPKDAPWRADLEARLAAIAGATP